MDNLSALLGFIDTARADRKYADSTARGLRAAVKLFANYVSEAEAASLNVLLQNLDNIGSDIYEKHSDDNITVTTLVVYKRRLRKLVHDYYEYGSSPDKMAAWNPRRHVAGLKPAAQHTAQTPVSIKPARVRAAKGAETAAMGMTTQPVMMNRTEISLRSDVRITLELPADLTPQEAVKIKQLVDLMGPTT